MTASSSSPWHIRELTSVGQKMGGGADTPALCGRTVSWDRGFPFNQLRANAGVCTICFAVLRDAGVTIEDASDGK
jgi:hypothetical protein